MRKKSNKKQKSMEFLFGKENAKKSMYQTVYETHHEIVRECEYCDKPLNRSEVNNFGSLCERCYMEEYYGDICIKGIQRRRRDKRISAEFTCPGSSYCQTGR